jgi:hypothetical protein
LGIYRVGILKMARNIRLSSSGSSSGGVTLPSTASFVCLCSTNFCSVNSYDSQNRKINNWVEIACCVCWTGGCCTTTCFNFPFRCYSDVCFYLAGQGDAACCVSTGILYFIDCTNGAQCAAPIYHFLSLTSNSPCILCCCSIPLCRQSCCANIVSGRFFPTGGNVGHPGIGVGFNIFPGYDPGYSYATAYTSRGFISVSSCVSWDRLSGFAWCNPVGGIYPNGSVSNAMFKFYGVPCV